MKEICPINYNQVEGNAARFNALFTTILLISFFTTQNIIPVVFLAFDFLSRGFLNGNYSVLAFLSRILVRTFSLEKKFVNAGPKIFSAKIGFFFASFTSIFALLGLFQVSLIAGSIFMACAALEAFAGFCVACKIYPYVNFLSNSLSRQ